MENPAKFGLDVEPRRFRLRKYSKKTQVGQELIDADYRTPAPRPEPSGGPAIQLPPFEFGPKEDAGEAPEPGPSKPKKRSKGRVAHLRKVEKAAARYVLTFGANFARPADFQPVAV